MFTFVVVIVVGVYVVVVVVFVDIKSAVNLLLNGVWGKLINLNLAFFNDTRVV